VDQVGRNHPADRDGKPGILRCQNILEVFKNRKPNPCGEPINGAFDEVSEIRAAHEVQQHQPFENFLNHRGGITHNAGSRKPAQVHHRPVYHRSNPKTNHSGQETDQHGAKITCLIQIQFVYQIQR
jgi:hypothetical protein